MAMFQISHVHSKNQFAPHSHRSHAFPWHLQLLSDIFVFFDVLWHPRSKSCAASSQHAARLTGWRRLPQFWRTTSRKRWRPARAPCYVDDDLSVFWSISSWACQQLEKRIERFFVAILQRNPKQIEIGMNNCMWTGTNSYLLFMESGDLPTFFAGKMWNGTKQRIII